MTRLTWSLGDVARLLPGVKPRLAAQAIRDALDRASAVTTPAVSKDTGGGRASARPPTRDVLFEVGAGQYGEFVVLTPAGVRLALSLYAAGELPMRTGRAPEDPPLELARATALVTPADMAAEEARLEALEAERPLSWALLERAYWRWVERTCPHAMGTRDATLWRRTTLFVYRDVAYRREQRAMPSNSGKTVRRWTEFHGGDGSIIADEPPPLNRRNDPERNWGLGRE